MKSLVLAEKPSVAKEIARVLGCGQKHKGYMEGPKYVVTWALGHLVTLAEPEEYDPKYKTWNFGGFAAVSAENAPEGHEGNLSSISRCSSVVQTA